jgi:hypothetical protein
MLNSESVEFYFNSITRNLLRFIFVGRNSINEGRWFCCPHFVEDYQTCHGERWFVKIVLL